MESIKIVKESELSFFYTTFPSSTILLFSILNVLFPTPQFYYFPPQFFYPSSTILFSLLNVFIPSSTIFIIFSSPPHFYCFSLLLYHISIVFQPSPPPLHFYCFSSTTTTFLLFSLHHQPFLALLGDRFSYSYSSYLTGKPVLCLV